MATGPLRSELLKGNQRLQDCAQVDPAHVMPGSPQSAHVHLIQEALRQVFGADIPKTELHYGPKTIEAVVAFKNDRNIFTRGTVSTVDPIVGINTIRELDKLLFDEDEKRGKRGGGGELLTLVVIRPDGPNPGAVDRAGFSAARLSRVGSGDWTAVNPFSPIHQYIPRGGRRTLVAVSHRDEPVAASFRMDGSPVAIIESATNNSVTLLGTTPGKGQLLISVEGMPLIRVNLIVRNPVSIPLDVFHLGNPAVPGTTGRFQAQVIPAINATWTAQTNITFTAGAVRDIDHMFLDGVDTVIDTELPLFFETRIGPPDPRKPTIRMDDLKREVRNPRAVTCFISPNFHDEQSDNIAGRGGLRTRVCWSKLRIGTSVRMVPSHEVGHSLGLTHVSAAGSLRFLMHPSFDKLSNNTLIPAETLVDLMD